MQLKREYYFKISVSQNEMLLKMKNYLKWIVTQMEFHSKWNVTQNAM